MANVTVNGTQYTGVDEVRLPMTGGGGAEQRFVLPPSGTKSITANGNGIDVAEYAAVDVNVPTGSEPVVNPLSVTENGTYTAPSGVDGYSPVTVNVQGSGIIHFEKSITLANDVSGGAMVKMVTQDELIAENLVRSAFRIDNTWDNFIVIIRRVDIVEGTQEILYSVAVSDSLSTTAADNTAYRRFAIVHAGSTTYTSGTAYTDHWTSGGIVPTFSSSDGIAVYAGSGYTLKAGTYETHVLVWGRKSGA